MQHKTTRGVYGGITRGWFHAKIIVSNPPSEFLIYALAKVAS